MSDKVTYDLAPRQDELDGVLMLRAALRYGLDVEVYPRQVLVATTDSGTELSFVHGVPATSGLGPVTYAQDKRMRRALMERAGIPVPKGATFTIGRGVPGAKNFAEQLRFPVTISPAIGDNGIETFRDLNSRKDMDAALHYLSTPPSQRENFSRAAYGLTELREPGEVNGRKVVPPGYMFMLEKQLSGEYLHFLVVDGHVRSVVQCEGHPSDGSLTGGSEILGQVHPELVSLAERAAAVIPGLAVVSLGVAVPDPYSSLDEQRVGVVEYSEQPRLYVQAAVDGGLASRLAEQILRSYGVSIGANLSQPLDDVSVRFEAHAMPDVEIGSGVIERVARSAGLTAEIEHTDRLAGIAVVRLAGSPGTIAHLANAFLDGRIEDQRVMLAVL